MKNLNYINGISCDGLGKTFSVVNPANGTVICEYKASTKEDVEKAVEVARQALPKWKSTPLEERARILVNSADLLIENQGNPGDFIKTDIMHLIIDEMGKAVSEAETEVFETSDILRYFGSEAKEFIKDEIPTLDQMLWATKTSVLKYQPVGVVGIIKAWNFPLEIPIWSIGAALLTGNTIVFKPSEHSPMIGEWLGHLFKKAGLPDGVFNVVVGNREVGEALVDSNIDMISFTGSTSTGKKIAQKCQERNIKVSLEMGGKDPAIVCNDAKLERAINGVVWGALVNAGQVCVSAERVYVQEKIYDSFVAGALDLVKTLNVGNGWDPSTDMITLISQSQLDKVDAQVKDAIAKGAKVLIGGHRLTGSKYDKGFYYAPTILVDVDNSMEVFTEETFGPVLSIKKFSNYEEVLNEANNSEYGLGSSVWTESIEIANFFANELEAGMVWINDINVCFPQCPWAGIKNSGVGYDLSKHGVYEYCKVKHINYENGEDSVQPWWYPYQK